MDSRVELAEMLDIPRVFHRNSVLLLEPRCGGPGDVSDPGWDLPHWRELVETFSRENPSEDEADAAAVIAMQPLLVPSRADCGMASCLLDEHQVLLP